MTWSLAGACQTGARARQQYVKSAFVPVPYRSICLFFAPQEETTGGSALALS